MSKSFSNFLDTSSSESREELLTASKKKYVKYLYDKPRTYIEAEHFS